MNANDIWSGHEYAYLENKPNNMDAPAGCDKVKAIKVIKRLEPGNQRETAFVLAEIIERNNNSWPYHKVGQQVELRARYFVDFWSDYAHRREEIEKETAEREKERQKYLAEQTAIREAARRERELHEQLARERREKEKNELLDRFSSRTGIPRNMVVMEYHMVGVNRNSPEFHRWLHDV